MAISKQEAAQLFQCHGLEGLPARVVADTTELVAVLRGEFADAAAVTVRACGHGEDKNLPRLVGASPNEACAWVAVMENCWRFVVQPYDELVFSLELVVTADLLFAELVAGIWELENSFAPATLRVGADSVDVTLPLQPHPAKFWNAKLRVPEWDLRLVEGWQVNATLAWLNTHAEALRLLAADVGCLIGIKAHYSHRFGVSPQNIHTANVVIPPADPGGAPLGTPVMADHRADVPEAEAVILLASIAREAHGVLVRLVERLRSGGVRCVYLQSGLLSHLAIALREQGVEVRRA